MKNNHNKLFLPSPELLFISISILLSAFAQLLMKIGMLDLHGLEDTNLVALLPVLVWITAGLACYAASMMFWMMALTKYQLSFAYPLLSLSYVLVYISASLIPQLNESISLGKTAGILLIITGVILVTQTKNKQ